VRAGDVRTIRKGERLGEVTFRIDDGTLEAPVVATASVPDPGPGWRLLHPIPMLGSFWGWLFGPGGVLSG
jgi:D-alanyl-D-alanine carboxypeptidase (penicillin-binding protein 5/6)